MSTLDQLTTPLELSDVQTSIYSVLAALGVNTTTWKPGSVVRTIILGCSLVIAALSRLTALIASSGFVTLSTGPWLALVALYVFGVTKITATFATGSITLNNTGGGVYGPLAPGALVVASAISGKKYANTASVSIAAMQLGVIVPVSAIEAGAASTANAGDISTIVAPNLTGVTSTNPTAIIGTDDELDTALQGRCEAKLGSLSPNGPADAYRYVATSAGRDVNGNPVILTATQAGTSVGITQIRVVKDGIGGLDAYLANATGGVLGTPDDLTSDLGVVDDLLQRFATPLPVTLRTHSATPRVIAIAYTLWIYQTALTDTQITTAVNAALTTFMQARPIGGDVISGVGAVWASALEAVIGSAQAAPGTPIAPFKIVLSTPDTILGAFEVPVLGVVTAIVTRVSRAGT